MDDIATAGGYNAAASPMHLFEDGELLTKEELKRRKDEAIEKQEKKSPFLVGTMAQVNEKICELDRCLQDYTQLVFDSRSSEDEDGEKGSGYPSSGSLASARHKRKEKEAAEISRFSGVYSIHSAVGQAPERVKNVHKISMKAKKKERKKSADSTRAKPKFVELFTFPGYHSSALTPLPHHIPNAEIFDKVLEAQRQIKRKVLNYDMEFSRILHSHMSQAILVDVYWWIFLEKYSSKKSFQPKFFNRIAHNYVKFLLAVQSYHFREAVLTNFPETMAQSVYVAFCETFPDSYKQFNDDFKEFLLQIVFEWMTGILPAPRKFLKWSSDLEPAGKKREAAMAKQPVKAETKKVALPANDWLSQIDAIDSMQRSIKKAGSEVSLSSRAASHRSKPGRGPGSDSSKSDDLKTIESVAGAQPKSKYPRPPAISQMKALTPVIEGAGSSVSAHTEQPLAEIAEETKSHTHSASKTFGRKSQLTKKQASARNNPQYKIKESHPACKGPDMVRSLFDIKGSCPLVSHYLKSYDLAADAGERIHVNRTEMKNLPPLDAPTYRDVIRNTFKTIKTIEKGIHKHIKQDMMQHGQFVVQQNKKAKQHREKQALLLGDQKEVKRLSNLLILEHSAVREKSEQAAAAEKLDELFERALLSVENHVTK